MKRVSDKFWIYLAGVKKFQEMEGKPVSISGFEMFDFFIHRRINGKTWTVSEATTGQRLGDGTTQNAAIQEAQKLLKGHGILGTGSAINKAIKTYGLSPRYSKKGGKNEKAGRV